MKRGAHHYTYTHAIFLLLSTHHFPFLLHHLSFLLLPTPILLFSLLTVLIFFSASCSFFLSSSSASSSSFSPLRPLLPFLLPLFLHLPSPPTPPLLLLDSTFATSQRTVPCRSDLNFELGAIVWVFMSF